MALLEHSKAIREYYNQVKDQYPELDHYQFERVCRAPWNYFKASMKEDGMPRICIKYLGKIFPSMSNIKKILGKLERCKSRLPQEYYDQRKEHLTNTLIRLQNEKEDHDDPEGGEGMD
jgi:hypothetical protein